MKGMVIFMSNLFPSREIVEMVKRQYPVGTRVELMKMDDVQAPPVGTKGTVRGVDDIASLLVNWDNGSSLNVIYKVDQVKRLEMNTRITYLYRDACNYKKNNDVIIKGKMEAQQLFRILSCLLDDTYFIPRSVGLPEERISKKYRTDDDHCWFEWELHDYSDVELTEAPATVNITVEELVAKFEAVKKWDEKSWENDYTFKYCSETLDS